MYCANCGAQNADTSKFCMKCGQALPQSPAPSTTTYQPSPPRAYHRPASAPANPMVPVTLIGGIAGIIGGALSIIGWFMPWSNVVITSFSGLQITLTALTGAIAGLGMLQYGSSGLLLVLVGLLVAGVNGAVPILGGLCMRSAIGVFQYRFAVHNRTQIDGKLDEVKSRSKTGIVLMIVIVVTPLVLSALLTAALPFMSFITQLGNMIPNSGLGSGLFVTIGGFVLGYAGARIARYLLSESNSGQATTLASGGLQLPVASPSVDILPSGQSATGTPLLTDTETQVLPMLAQGLSESDIALRLAIPDSVVSRAISDLYGKLNVTSRSELVSRAKQIQLL